MTITTARESGGTKSGVILTGAVRDVYSREILFNAQPNLVHAQFADVQTDLQAEAGDTIKFTRYEDLRGSAELSEVENISVTHMENYLVAIEVREYGFGIGQSERAIRTSWDDVIGRGTQLLGQHYGRHVDSLVRNEFIAAGALQAFYPASVANRAALTSADILNVRAIKDGAEQLAINKATKVNGTWVCIVHPHQARGLRDDSAWLEAHKYAAPEEIFMGEIGMIEGTRFIETTNTRVIKAGTGDVYEDGYDSGDDEALYNATEDIYQALMLGSNAVGWAVALPVELRTNGIIDFGRTRELAWYAIEGTGQIRPENVVTIETA